MTQQISLSIFTDFPYQSIKITRLLSIFIDTDFYRLSTPGCKQKSLVYISVSYMTWTHYRVLDHYWDVSQITNLSAKNNKLKVRRKYRQTCPGEWFPKTACSITAVFPTQLPPTTTSRKYFGISHKLLKSPTKNCQSACNFTDLYHQPRQIHQNFNNGCPAELRLQVDWDDWRTTRSGGRERELWERGNKNWTHLRELGLPLGKSLNTFYLFFCSRNILQGMKQHRCISAKILKNL